MAWPQALNPVAIIKDLKRKIASLQRQWRDTRSENEQLRNEIEQLRPEKGQVERERDRLREQNEKLKKQLDQALRTNKRQAAPFSRGRRNPKPKRPGRKAGRAYGLHRRKHIPEQVDEVIAVPPPAQCPDCGGKLTQEKTQAQYQQEIVRKTIGRRFDIPICRCTVCQRRVQLAIPCKPPTLWGPLRYNSDPTRSPWECT
jgi:exonuclease VII large subunit